MEKSYVSIAQKICLVTGKMYDCNELLLDTRLGETLEPKTTIGYGISPEVQKLFDEGYVALIEIDPSKSKEINGRVALENAHRTGNAAFLKRHVLKDILINITIQDEQNILYIGPDTFQLLVDMEKNAK